MSQYFYHTYHLQEELTHFGLRVSVHFGHKVSLKIVPKKS